MALSASDIAILAPALDASLQGTFLQGFNEFDHESFFWSLPNKEKLVFVLSHGAPRVYIGGKELGQSSLNTAFATFVRKALTHARVIEVTAEPNERILYFHLERTNEVYKKEKVTLVFEMLPNKPRVLLLDEAKKILISTNYSPLDSKRPLLKGMSYTLPEKGNYVPKEGACFDYEEYQKECLEEESRLIEKRKTNKYGDVIKKLKAKEKAAQKKIAAIEKDIEEAKLHLDDAIYGDYIYTDYSSFHKGDEYFLYEGKKIPLDPKKSPQENATAFYKKAKKAKVTLEQANINLEKGKEEEENATTLLAMISSLDGASLEEFGPSLGILPSPKEKQVQGTALLPYEIIDGKTRILFGKNAKQNEFLSFLYTTDKELLWFHAKEGSGSHVILFSASPSKEEISLACEVALYASGHEAGEVMYTQRKNIKRGNYTGQAIVKSYQAAYFPNIEEKAKNLCKNAVKVKITRRLQGN